MGYSMIRLKLLSSSEYKKYFKEDCKIKNEIIKEFIFFLNGGLNKKDFSSTLYAHLTLHGGFPSKNNSLEFYSFYFSNCEITKDTYNTHSEMQQKKWIHIINNFYLSYQGELFANALFSAWNQYGSYCDLNKVLQNIYKDFILNLSLYIKNSDINNKRRDK